MPPAHLAAAFRAAESLCIKCGFCLPACPTYRETGNESASPRGRLDLMYAVAQGRLALRVAEPALGLCLGCQACETACPSGIRFHDMLEASRCDAAERRGGAGRRAARLALDTLLPSPRLLRAAVWALWAYRRFGLQAVARASRILWLAPPVARLERSLPPVSRPVRWRDAALPMAAPPVRERAALLTGCVMDAAFGEVHAATAYVLRANGIALAEAPGQTCCGALHLHAGEREGARTLLRRNIAAFERAGGVPVIVNAAGCGAHLKQAGALLADDPEWAGRARRLGERVQDVCEFLAARPLAEPPVRVERTVAYDDPCHLVHAQKLREPPRALLGRIAGLTLVPLREAEMCCGSAGSYSAVQPEMSRRVLARKMEHIQASGAETVATGNPGCLWQLRLGAHERGLSVRVVHPIELLAEAYGQAARQR
jgi:glycolate oxidase iron-sulfur subunit